MKKAKIFFNGLINENPTFVLFLGMCPTLAITTSINNALGMGIAAALVLVFSNLIISLLSKYVPNEIRIPVYIIVIATLVTIIEMLVKAYAQGLYASLGIFLPLIVVNCIILGRAEAFANKNSPVDSIIDGLGAGLGFTVGLLAVAIVRQLIGTGSLSLVNPFNESVVLFELNVLQDYAISIFTQPTGAFLTLGVLAGIVNIFKNKNSEKAKKGGK